MPFDAPDALNQLAALGDAELDALAFGVVRMSLDGTVTAYNATESQSSHLSREATLGRHFFTEVAPCTNNYLVAQRFLDEAELDATIPYVFTFRMRPTPVQLRMLRSATSSQMFLLIERGA